MASIHFICPDRLHLTPDPHPVYESGNWDITEADARRLVGGMLFLHKTKATPSYFGGRIESYRVVDTEHAHRARIVFRLTSLLEARQVRWRGDRSPRAWTSGVVDDEQGFVGRGT